MYVSVNPDIAYPLNLDNGILWGLGATSGASLVAAGGSVAAGTAAALASAGIIAGAAVPFIGPAIAGVTLAIEAILNSGCGQTCVVTSQWANQAAAQLQANLDAYFAQPAPRAQSLQTLAIQNYQKIWNTLVSQCSQPNLGQAGQNCIGDRQQGACKWHQTGQPQYPGQPALGDCWNWYDAYYVPLASDPNVVPDSEASPASVAASGNVISELFSGSSSTTLLLLGAAGLLVLGVALS
jgi:hypothetical protein